MPPCLPLFFKKVVLVLIFLVLLKSIPKFVFIRKDYIILVTTGGATLKQQEVAFFLS